MGQIDGSVTNGPGHALLVEHIKAWQRAHPSHNATWRSYCEEWGGGTYDPSRYDLAFLKTAVAELGTGGEEELGDSGLSQALLAERVKRWQRASLANTEAWRRHCDEQGDGSYDPGRYAAGFLRAALAQLAGAGSAAIAVRGTEGAEDAASLMEEVKAWQRASLANAAAWRKYCDDRGDGSYDPGRYDAAFLGEALAELAGRGRQRSAWLVGTAVGATGGSGPLMERVKELQRSSVEAAQAWREYCTTVGDGSYDPIRYEASFLRAWLERTEV